MNEDFGSPEAGMAIDLSKGKRRRKRIFVVRRSSSPSAAGEGPQPLVSSSRDAAARGGPTGVSGLSRDALLADALAGALAGALTGTIRWRIPQTPRPRSDTHAQVLCGASI